MSESVRHSRTPTPRFMRGKVEVEEVAMEVELLRNMSDNLYIVARDVGR
jgi:hypothetical protein